jgi:hypothetical protein
VSTPRRYITAGELAAALAKYPPDTPVIFWGDGAEGWLAATHTETSHRVFGLKRMGIPDGSPCVDICGDA